jgi:ABC-type bacteriocin/lantibiotic exporter with double-glycine peptidase domain
VYALFNGLVNLSLPLGIQAIINLIQGGAMSTSWMIMVGIVILGISLTGFFQYMQLRIVENISQKIFARSSFEFAYRFPKINYRALYNYYAPELANRFFDTLTFQKSLPKILIDFSLASFQIIVGLFVLSLYHSFFVFFAILLLILVFFLINYIGPMGMKTNLKESKYKYDVAYWLEEVARTKVTFKLSPDNTINIENTDGKVLNYINARESHFKVLVHQFFWLILFKVLIAAALLIIGGILVFRQEMNIGQFVAAEIIILLVLASIEKIITSLESIYDLLTALEKIGYVTDLPLDKEKAIKLITTINSNNLYDYYKILETKLKSLALQENLYRDSLYIELSDFSIIKLIKEVQNKYSQIYNQKKTLNDKATDNQSSGYSSDNSNNPEPQNIKLKKKKKHLMTGLLR